MSSAGSASQSTLVQRTLSFQFVLGSGSFGESPGSNTLTVTGAGNYPLRARVEIAAPGAGAKSTADIRIWGMTKAQMDQMSVLGTVITSQRNNSILIQAGDVGGTLATAFSGTMFNAYGAYNEQPEAPFVVQASSAYYLAIKPAPVTSFVGTTPVATILQGLATAMGFTFQNSGVTATLSHAYYYGSAWDQALQIVQDAGIEWNCCDGGVLAIWNAGGSRTTPTPTLIAPPPKGAMIGYPTFNSFGIDVKNVYASTLQFGNQIQVESSLFNSQGIKNVPGGPPENGIYTINGLQHILESGTPGGLWESDIQGVIPSYGPVVPSVR